MYLKFSTVQCCDNLIIMGKGRGGGLKLYPCIASFSGYMYSIPHDFMQGAPVAGAQLYVINNNSYENIIRQDNINVRCFR